VIPPVVQDRPGKPGRLLPAYPTTANTGPNPQKQEKRTDVPPIRDQKSDPASVAVLRILDANINRATEGLRVLEEYVRFTLDDAHLSRLCKDLRHATAAAARSIDWSQRLSARDTLRDVGTRIATDAEYVRDHLQDVLAANAVRVEQALRCLEEYSKAGWPQLAAEFETLRYRAYSLTRAIAITRHSIQRLAEARLYVLIDGGPSPDAFVALVQTLTAVGTPIIQLRDKGLNDRTLLERAKLLRALTRSSGTLFIMNDRPDLAVLSDADGVHVGQEELSVKDARTVVGPHRLIGVSTHAIDQARQAVLDGASYLGCGPTFPSGTKEFSEFPGVPFLRQVHQEIRLPAFAIGGITRDRLDQVLAAGFTRVAVSGAVAQASDPAGEVQQFLSHLAPAGEYRADCARPQ
jgi:thiamine-phosphate pyrophosphorylase